MVLHAGHLVCEYCGNLVFPEPNEDGVRVLDDADEKCPFCAVPMKIGAIGGEHVRYCTRCRGLLAKMDAFTDIVQDLRSRREASAAATQPPEWSDLDRKVRCPRCGAVMDTHLYGGPGNVIIDACEHCAVVWLDARELDRVVRGPDPQVGVE